MNKLNFASVGEAFKLGSEQIKDTREEIEKLKKLVIQTSNFDNKPKEIKETKENYVRIGEPDKTTAVFVPNSSSTNTFDFTLMNLMSDPKFDDIVKNYVLVKHPEWLLNSTLYTPAGSVAPPVAAQQQNFSTFTKEQFGVVCDTVSNLIKFIVFSLVFYFVMVLLTKK
jgi:hypothetical protein